MSFALFSINWWNNWSVCGSQPFEFCGDFVLCHYTSLWQHDGEEASITSAKAAIIQGEHLSNLTEKIGWPNDEDNKNCQQHSCYKNF